MRLYSNVFNYAIYTEIITKSIMRINVQIGISVFAYFKHKVKIYNHCAYTLTIVKKFNDKSFEMYFLMEQF